MPVVDTLRLKTRLSEGGMPEAQAQVFVEELDEALSTAIARETATKADVVELRASIGSLKERVAQRLERLETLFIHMRSEMKFQRWMVGGVLALTAIAAGIGIRSLFV